MSAHGERNGYFFLPAFLVVLFLAGFFVEEGAGFAGFLAALAGFLAALAGFLAACAPPVGLVRVAPPRPRNLAPSSLSSRYRQAKFSKS